MNFRKFFFSNVIPGIFMALVVAVPSILIHNLYKPISAVAIAIVMGLLVRNIFGLPVMCEAGNKFIVKKVLRFAIILLGVRLSFQDILSTGGNAVLIIICCIVSAITLTAFLSKWLKLPLRLGILIGVGSSICGNSAIVATAPAIDANDEEVAFAVSTITLFGVLAVLIFPVLGHFLSMTDTTFGKWAGVAINDTSQVVTAGYMYSEEAGDVATVVKLTRNLFMAPVILIMSFVYYRVGNKKRKGDTASSIDYKKAFPFFVFGFLGMAILNSLHVFTPEGISIIKLAANYLIVLSISAVGLGTSLSAMRKTGLKPFYVGLVVSIVMACLSLTLINLLN